MTYISNLKPGQSITPEQVRNLPDGARVRVENSDGKVWTELDAENQTRRDNIAYGISNGGWSRAYLVSLPEPKEPHPVVKDSLTTERIATEIEKENSPMTQKAARALLDNTMADLAETTQPNGICDRYAELAAVCHDYLRAFDYAKSIGAIE